MNVIISAGGTGGHIYPALAIINQLKEKDPNVRILYIGTHNRMEKDIVPEKGIPFESLEMYGLYRKKIYKNVKTLSCFYKSYKKCIRLMKEFQPDLVVGVGGYVTAPVILAAHKLKIKTAIHEQNSVPGASNQFLSKYVDKIMVSFPSSMKEFPKEKTVYTGNPCSEDALKVEPIKKEEYGLSNRKKLVTIVMGSLGASGINQFLIDSMRYFEKKEYEVAFVTGKQDYDHVMEYSFPSNVHIYPYVPLTSFMKKTDLMISRAGASTLSEIMALHVPSILIPSPYVPNNHQYKNAMGLVDAKAAVLLEEKELKDDILVNTIDQILSNPIQIEMMKKNLEKMAVTDSATRIVKELYQLVTIGGENNETRN